MAGSLANAAGVRHPISGNSIVVAANGGTHTPRRLWLSTRVDGFFQQQMAGIMGPGVRRDDIESNIKT
jgi:hypothetical protein